MEVLEDQILLLTSLDPLTIYTNRKRFNFEKINKRQRLLSNGRRDCRRLPDVGGGEGRSRPRG